VVEARLLLGNPTGLHARPAALFASEASRFASDVRIRKGTSGSAVNAKSALSILTLDCVHGDEVVIIAEGDDAEAAVAHLSQLVEDGLGEEPTG
jgi:phosphotransferase system HPr (HPr) family protein